MIYPQPLNKGDAVAIVSPASIIEPGRVEGASKALEKAGYHVKVGRHALGRFGSYSGSAEQRLADFTEAWLDPEVRAIICSRGGYGCIHLLEGLAKIDLRRDPKWIVGYSDVSALHALMWSRGIVSVHGSMAKILAEQPIDSEPNRMLLNILSGKCHEVAFDAAPGSRPGIVKGQLVGGNLAVLQGLMRTPYDIFQPERILFVEDIAEPIYKVERIFTQMKLAGILDGLNGLIIGKFTEYRSDANFDSMEEMLRQFTDSLDIPVAYGAPIGHFDGNLPLIHGAECRMTVIDRKCVIKFENPSV